MTLEKQKKELLRLIANSLTVPSDEMEGTQKIDIETVHGCNTDYIGYTEPAMTLEEIAEKYHLSSRQIIFSWMDKYVNEREIVSLPETEEDMAKKTPEERVEELKAENKRLSKALELERLRSEAYSTMIDLAEKTFNIPVRKKSGTKQ